MSQEEKRAEDSSVKSNNSKSCQNRMQERNPSRWEERGCRGTCIGVQVVAFSKTPQSEPVEPSSRA
jgi:hypothetical protein